MKDNRAEDKFMMQVKVLSFRKCHWSGIATKVLINAVGGPACILKMHEQTAYPLSEGPISIDGIVVYNVTKEGGIAYVNNNTVTILVI